MKRRVKYFTKISVISRDNTKEYGMSTFYCRMRRCETEDGKRKRQREEKVSQTKRLTCSVKYIMEECFLVF